MDMAAGSPSLGTPEKRKKYLSSRVPASILMQDSNWFHLHHMLHQEPLLLPGELARPGSFAQHKVRVVESLNRRKM